MTPNAVPRTTSLTKSWVTKGEIRMTKVKTSRGNLFSG